MGFLMVLIGAIVAVVIRHVWDRYYWNPRHPGQPQPVTRYTKK